MGSLVHGRLSNGASNNMQIENGYCPSSGLLLSSKRQKVCSVRSFPPGCGRNAQCISLMLQHTEAVASLGDEKNLAAAEGTLKVAECDRAKASEIGYEPLSHPLVHIPVKLELPDTSDGLMVNVIAAAGKVNGDEVYPILEVQVSGLAKTLVNNTTELPKDLQEVEVQDRGKSVEALESKPVLVSGLPRTLVEDATELPKGLQEVDVQAMLKIEEALESKPDLEIGPMVNEMVSSGVVKTWLPPQCPATTDANVSRETALRNKYPRRMVSATRDFPSFCGRNAPCLTEKERLIISLGSQTLTASVEASVQHGLLRETVKAKDERSPVRERARIGFRESKGDFQAGNGQKRKLVESLSRQNTKPQKVTENSYGKSPKRRQPGDDFSLRCDDDKVIVHGLMAAENCPWRHVKGARKTCPDDSMTESKLRGPSVWPITGQEKSKSISRACASGANDLRGRFMNKKSLPSGKDSREGKVAPYVKDKENFAVPGQDEDSPADQAPCEFEVTLPRFGPKSSSHGSARDRVRETLRLFQAICRKLLQGEETKLRDQEKLRRIDLIAAKKKLRRIDLIAAKIVKAKGKEVNTAEQFMGSVPGVEVGDEFQYRVELALVGIHRLYQAGIDSMKKDGMILATSIVASGGYADDLENPDFLVYSGMGGNIVGKNKQPEDQKLEGGNLALKNSISAKNPVRVVHASKEVKAPTSDARSKAVLTYSYDGLYTVERYWHDVGPHGQLVFKFELKRIPGQPEVSWKEVVKSNKFSKREGICMDDISTGKEFFPICAVNSINNEKPPKFNYVTEMKYPDWYCTTRPKGCECVGGCSNSPKCSCVVKNGGQIPYNHSGAIVEVKPLVYECGPSCKCPPSCYNRVSQHGIKIQLELFKTKLRGWGVRSLTSIPSGSFICEYTGELLEDMEADTRKNDEYLFDIGQNYSDCSLTGGPSCLTSEVEDCRFTIDAALCGNVGRFINHSCSPNLYAQNVLYDHGDKRMPHIMLFAAENIPPLKELTYHYNYSVDHIQDSDGNIKMKSCHCGSAECTGRMY